MSQGGDVKSVSTELLLLVVLLVVPLIFWGIDDGY